MRFLHTSDWHLGISLGTKSLLQDQEAMFEQMYQVIATEHIDAVLVAGDVYDSTVSLSDAIRLYNQVVTTICLDLQVPVIMIAGNHDGAQRLASCAKLLKKSGLYITGNIGRDMLPVEIQDADIYSIPYFNIDEVKNLFPEKKDEIVSYEMAAKVLCDDILSRIRPGKRNIVLSHAFIVNSELSDSERATKVGGSTAISKEVFDGFDYVALGHIHKPQSISKTIRYCGTPLKYSFGKEENQVKSFTIVDTKTMEQTLVKINPLHDVRSITGTYEEILDMERSSDYVFVRVTDQLIGLEKKSIINEKFPNMVELQGKTFLSAEEETHIHLEDIRDMKEIDIIKDFFEEKHGVSFTEAMRDAIMELLEEADREEDVQ